MADEVSDTALLLTSEVVTNAYQYSDGAILMSAGVRGIQLRVSVTDSGDGTPIPTVPAADHVLEARGRGLTLVAALATRWGVKLRTSRGKAVWFELEPVR